MDEQRKLTSELSASISRKYGIYSKMITRTLRPFAELKAEPEDISEAMKKIKQIVRMMDIEAIRWSNAAAKKAYTSKRRSTAAAAERVGNLETGWKNDPEAAIQRLADKSAKAFVVANSTIERTANKFLDAYKTAFGATKAAQSTEQVQAVSAAMEKELERKVELYLARGYSEDEISRSLRNYLGKMLKGEDFIEVGGRFYSIASFAEMTAREQLHNIYVEATVAECNRYGNDLVQMSRHQDPCEMCAALEGMVFSISGQDDEFPPLNEPVEVEVEGKIVMVDPKAPHPNCEHNLNPVTRNILEAAGEGGRFGEVELREGEND